MSEFDKEAERKKLREKFAREEERRSRTSNMSELLLKGATMTNKHHECGSPVFRWDGQEFCPTCQAAPAGEGVAQVPDEEVTGGHEATTVDIEEPSAEPDVGSPEADEQTADEQTAESTPPAPQATGSNGENEGTSVQPISPYDPESSSDSGRPPERQSREPADTMPVDGHQEGELSGAGQSLRRLVADLVRRAEQTDDVETTRQLLAAVQEAAAALEAVRKLDA